MKSRVITNLKKDTNIAITFTEDENEIKGEKMILNKAKNSPKKVTKVYAKKKLQSEKDTDPEKPELAEDDSQIEKNKCIIEKNNDTTQRLIAIDKILELYPQLKKDKKQIMDVVLLFGCLIGILNFSESLLIATSSDNKHLLFKYMGHLDIYLLY
jgi:hypothetical protein